MRYLIIIIIFFTSCSSSKKVDKQTINLVRKANVDSVVVERKDSVKVSVDEKLKTSDNTIEFYTPGEEVLWDSAAPPFYSTKIIYHPDGSFEATGVKKVNLKTTEWQKKYDSLNNEYNLEINKRMTLEEQMKGKTVNKEKEKRPVAVAWLLFLFIGFVTGFYAKYKLK